MILTGTHSNVKKEAEWDSAICPIWRDEALIRVERDIDGLNEYFGKNWGWIGFFGATTRGWLRNKSGDRPEKAGNSGRRAK